MLRKRNKYCALLMLLLIFSGFAACTTKLEKKAEQPADLIHRDTMVSIFVDLRLLDAVLNFEQQQGNRKLNDIRYYLHNSVMEKYDITREQFERSFTYYQVDLEEIDKIYADAITRLSKLKSKIEQE